MFRELPLHYLPHELLSKPQTMPEVLNLQSSQEELIDATSVQQAEGSEVKSKHLLSCHSAQPMTFEITKSGVLHGFAFWFNQVLTRQSESKSETEPEGHASMMHVLSTEPSNDYLNHWRQAVVAIQPALKVIQGQEVSVQASMGLGVNAGVDIRLV